MTLIGQQVGNYVIRQQLGEGGMGAVYLAEHPQIGKKVALKVLHAELAANQEVVNRFFHEAKSVNDIAHPNIVDIVDFGTVTTDSGPLVYLVMELISGPTLTNVMEQEPLGVERTTRIATQVADALAASHERGIVHRDLKPDNVMLVTRGRAESVKLLDFGIAKVAGSQSTKTRTGMVMGTPIYMSPEQCDGRGLIDHRTDIYALGIMLYEMLTGRAPFTGSGYGEILVKQMTEAPAPLSSVRPGISPHLELVVLKALQKRPQDRYETMHELASALAQPEQYVEARGGLRGFLPSAIASAAPSAATVMVSAAAPVAQHPTTMSSSVGQVAVTTQLTNTKSKTPLIAMGGGVIAAAVAAIFVLTRGGGDKAAGPEEPSPTAPVAAHSPDPAPAPTPTPAPAPAPAPAPDPTPAPTAVPAPSPPATVRVAIASKPAGATVFVAGESKARCTTPCSFDAPRDDKETTITLKLAGFGDAKRTIQLNADQDLDLELATKKSSPRPPVPGKQPTPPGKQPTKQPIGDNTLNPFDN